MLFMRSMMLLSAMFAILTLLFAGFAIYSIAMTERFDKASAITACVLAALTCITFTYYRDELDWQKTFNGL